MAENQNTEWKEAWHDEYLKWICGFANAQGGKKATRRREKLQKQMRECKEYDECIAHLALARILIDLDDGVKVNYEKVQTVDGVKYPISAKI